MKYLNIIVISLILLVYSCYSNEEETFNGTLSLKFNHVEGGNPVMYDQPVYSNAAGNQYEITNIQWFISDVSLVDNTDKIIPLSNDWLHYIDSDLPETQKWTLMDGIPPGEYSSIRFVFGIRGEKNEPMMFTDPPESNMIWPYHMGGDEGGYHYMKLNGFWVDLMAERTPFNFHIGVGQVYDNDQKVSDFIQNWFETELPFSSFTMPAGGLVNADINMNIEDWFQNPKNYDHNDYGGSIMDNQEAMGTIRDNGHNVFSISIN